MPIPDPALVVLVGASGSGKSTWAAARYRPEEVVSSDALRAVVGSGPADLDASDDAFAVLEAVVAARIGRHLTTVVDTLGFDPGRRRSWLAAARASGVPAVAVLVTAPDAVCRSRNALRDRPVPAKVLTQQLRQSARVQAELADDGWDEVLVVDTGDTEPSAGPVAPPPGPARATPGERTASTGVEVVLQLSRFPWGEDPFGWLRAMALAADEVGFSGIALMDHLVQVPQVGRAWDPIPEPWVALGALAGLGTGLRLGTLVTPVTFRPPGVTAKAAATLSALTGGRTFLGVGAGWWEREHAAFGVPFPPAAERLDDLDAAIRTMRALWAAGTKPYDDGHVALPETTCYPRPTSPVTVVVGGGGEHRTLRIAAELGDACNLTTTDPEVLSHKVSVLRRHCADLGRDEAEVAVTVLDVPVVGRDRDDVWARVERMRGRTSAATYAARSHAGTVGQHRERHAALAALGVSTVFLTTPDLAGPEDVLALADLVR
ncbi:LLM class flavin-dependent oxidoreductase [Phycicoccus avicenniae]|uniref:LLM class flavin-dependent oxidoreductase n=1 Tax=Phycicoccus avicenniae TaxID=2828860 RepID=UPI003D2AAC5A